MERGRGGEREGGMEEREAGSRFARSEERESVRTRIQRRKTRTGQRHSR